MGSARSMSVFHDDGSSEHHHDSPSPSPANSISREYAASSDNWAFVNDSDSDHASQISHNSQSELSHPLLDASNAPNNVAAAGLSEFSQLLSVGLSEEQLMLLAQQSGSLSSMADAMVAAMRSSTRNRSSSESSSLASSRVPNRGNSHMAESVSSVGTLPMSPLDQNYAPQNSLQVFMDVHTHTYTYIHSHTHTHILLCVCTVV